MVKKKQELDVKKLEITINRMSVLKNPINVRIIFLLEKEQELCVTDVYTKLNFSQVCASFYLRKLRNLKIIDSERRGQKIFYSVNAERFARIIEAINLLNN